MTSRVFVPLALEHIYVSPGHSYVGRHGLGAVPQPIPEVDAVESVAGGGGEKSTPITRVDLASVTILAQV